MATTRTLDPSNQQQRVVTQEVKTTATVTSGDQVRRPLGMACTRFICMNRLTFIYYYFPLLFLFVVRNFSVVVARLVVSETRQRVLHQLR